MNLMSVAFKNLKRKKVRSFLTIGGVAIAVAVLVSLMGFDKGYEQALNGDIEKMGYQVLVTAKGCPYEAATLMLKGGGGLRYMEKSVYDKIVKDPRIEKITPQLVATEFDKDRQNGQGGIVLYMGVDDSYLRLKPWVKFRSGGWFSGDDADEAVMGYEVAELEQRVPGDQIFVPNLNKVLKVVGIFERTGTQDDGITYLPLKAAQRIFKLPDKLTGIGIKLKDIGTVTAFEEDLYNEPGIQVISMAEVKGTIFNLVSSAQLMTRSVAIIAILVAIIGVINTILMSVFERTKEIGVMKAIGASRLAIFQVIWMETTLICVLGGIVGDVIAIVGTNAVELILRKILPYAPSGRLVLITPELLLISFIGAVVMGLIAWIYPAQRAASLRPVEAIRLGD